MDFDPRDYDSRDDERFAPERGRVGNSDRDEHDLDDNPRLSEFSSRDRDEGGTRELGRGPGDSRESRSDDRRDARDDARWCERERDERTRDTDPREVFTRHLNLPRGLERELVRDRDREYTLRGSESRTLATVGAVRVVSSRDLQDYNGRPTDPRAGDLRHLREQGLVETVRVPGYREQTVTLTKDGRSLLESHRDRDQGDRQAFYNGIKRERELSHDLQVYRAYERAAERLEERSARIERVVLDYELKREYQLVPAGSGSAHGHATVSSAAPAVAGRWRGRLRRAVFARDRRASGQLHRPGAVLPVAGFVSSPITPGEPPPKRRRALTTPESVATSRPKTFASLIT